MVSIPGHNLCVVAPQDYSLTACGLGQAGVGPKALRALCRNDIVFLDHERPTRIAEVQAKSLHMLVLDLYLDVGVQVGGEGRQAEGREERVLDGPHGQAPRLNEGGKTLWLF